MRELLWVNHCSYTIDNDIKIKLRIDTDIFGFQDFNNNKTITITNVKTKAEMKAKFVSLESNLYFYIKSIKSKKVLAIVDKFAGQNIYDYSTLELISKEDCFSKSGDCGGFNDISFTALGTPYLTYDNNGFHK